MKKITRFIFVLAAMIAWGNVTNAAVLADPSTSAPTPPVRTSAQVVSAFSDAYSNGAGSTNFNPGWSQATTQSVIQIGTDNVLKYSNLNYQGTEFGNHINGADMTFMHVDVYTTDETSLQITPISPGHEFLYTLPTLVQNSWNSYDIPLSTFTGVVLSDLFQIKVVGTNGKTVYLDNIYFYNETTDNQVPTDFTATKGTITSDAVELILNATDNSGAVFYEITYNTTTVIASGASGVQKSFFVSGLNGSSDYNFSIVAKDRTGNAVGTPIVVSATTLSPISAAPTPTIDASKVISIFGDTYTNIPTNGWEDWYGNTFSTVILNGNPTMKDVASCCFGTSITTPIDITTMTKLHVDVYPLTSTTMQYGFVTDPANPLQTLTLITGQWNSIDLNLADLKTQFPTADYTQIKQIGFWNTAGTFYVDNIYFYSDTATGLNNIENSNSISLYPNPVIDKLTVSAKSKISQVTVCNLLGQSVKTAFVNSLNETIDLSDVASGNYFITVKLATGIVSTYKTVKL